MANSTTLFTQLPKNTSLIDLLTTYAPDAILSTSTPASAGATGVAGQVVWDASYIYVCVATNTWKRVAIATW